MPYAPGKICGRPLCNVRVPHGVTYCEQHEQEWREKRKARKSTKRKAQYLDPGDLSKWRRVRAAFLQRNSICAECGRPATVVDHIVPHRGDAALLWDEGNYQPMCSSCHSRKTAKLDGGFGNARRHADGAGRKFRR